MAVSITGRIEASDVAIAFFYEHYARQCAARVLRLARPVLWLGQVSHNGAQAEVAWQIRGEAPKPKRLSGVELYLPTGEVRKYGAGGVDGVIPLQTD